MIHLLERQKKLVKLYMIQLMGIIKKKSPRYSRYSVEQGIYKSYWDFDIKILTKKYGFMPRGIKSLELYVNPGTETDSAVERERKRRQRWVLITTNKKAETMRMKSLLPYSATCDVIPVKRNIFYYHRVFASCNK